MKFRCRVKGSSRATKPTGGSSSSNPKSTRHRGTAKAQRLANICPLLPVDERVENAGERVQRQLETALLKQLPLGEMSLGEKRRKGRQEDMGGGGGGRQKQDQGKQQKPVKLEPSQSALLEQLSSPEDGMSLENRQKLLRNAHQLWQILPAHLSASLPDYQRTMPVLAPILGSALNERPDLRLTALGSIRAALQMDAEHGFDIMRRFGKNFLPILFSIYTASEEAEEGEGRRRVDPRAVRLSTLETIRLYIPHTPKPLLKQYIGVALKKLTGPEAPKGQFSEKNLLLSDLLVAMCISAEAEDLEAIFSCLEPWFEADDGRMQKKAYRTLAQIYQRHEEDQLKPFFHANGPHLERILGSGTAKLSKSARQWRIALHRNVLDSFHDFQGLSQFCDKISEEIFSSLSPSNSSPTRQQAANCLLEMARELLRLWTLEGENVPNPLDSLFAKLFQMFNVPADQHQQQQQCALIGLNFLAQKQLKNASALSMAQLVSHSTHALRNSTDQKCRLLAIRLMRTISAKMQPFVFEQYKDLILDAVFSQPTKDPTVRVRKSNALLLSQLLERLGIEALLKAAEEKEAVWPKMLKNLEKMRRRRERKKDGSSGNAEGREVGATGARSTRAGTASSVVSSNSALSTLISLGAKTAQADSIFDILNEQEDSTDEEEEGRSKERRKRRGKSSRLSVVIEGEGEEDDPLDLLDRKALEGRVNLVRKEKRKLGGGREKEQGKEGGPFRVNREGKLLIEDLEGRKQRKRRRKDLEEEQNQKEEGEEEEEEDGG